MQSTATTPEQYFHSLPADRKSAMLELRNVILKNLPKGFTETMAYGMVAYVIPHSIYPAGYHCDSKQALPFMSIASQKNFIAVYHMGIYADSKLLEWFASEYAKHYKTKLDMGKSCMRFKKTEQVPFKLIAELTEKISAEQWIAIYEQKIKR